MNLFSKLFGSQPTATEQPQSKPIERKQLAPDVTCTVKYPALTDRLPIAETSTRWDATPGVQAHPTYGLWRIVGDPIDPLKLRDAYRRGDFEKEWRENDLLMFIGMAIFHVRRKAIYHMDSLALQWLFENLFTRGGVRIAPDCTPIIVTLSTPEVPQPFRWWPSEEQKKS